MFDSTDGRFNASVGCNTMLGGYSTSAGTLSFSQPASTMMACPDDLAECEGRLVAAITATTRYLIGGHILRLMDEAGDVTAEFEAVYLP